MNNFKLILCCIASALLINGCSKILEPVAFFGEANNDDIQGKQEEFEINIKDLTFKTAKKANNDIYSRQLILTGSGSLAKVVDEADFLTSNFPKAFNSPDYILGIGDELLFIQLNEFISEITQWPNNSEKSEYLLGIGDQLTFVQSNDINRDLDIKYGDGGEVFLNPKGDTLVQTQGVIGSNGNVLLYGLGNILASNRTLDDVRTEIRNILIRDGLVPNFQLDISNFQSKKAYVSVSSIPVSFSNITGESRVINLNNIPVTLKEIALAASLTETSKNFALIQLTRNDQIYRMTASQLFDRSAKEIIIQDNDQIEIRIVPPNPITIKTIVGSKGNILLDNIGSIAAVNRTIEDIYQEISSILIKKGFKPSFQLELSKFASKKAYLIQKNQESIVIPLTNKKITLRELILKYKKFETETLGLSIVTLKRNGQVFRMTEDKILDPRTPDIWIIDNDQVEVEILTYKQGQVFALSGAGNAKVVSIDPSKRETLADILFTDNGPLNNLLARRSEVYLLRGKSPSLAYHLDTQNVSRILVATKTELRPNDIVYVADRPIISFSRTLAELLPLRILLRDIQDKNIP